MVGVGLLTVWLTGPSGTATLPPLGGSDGTASQTREARGTALVERLERALARGDVEAARDLGATRASSRQLGQLVRTTRQLAVRSLELRYVALGPEVSAQERARFGDDAFLVDVELTWRLGGQDATASSVETPVVLTDDGRASAFVTAHARAGSRAPIWFTDRVVVERPTPGALLVRSRSLDSPRLAELAEKGVRTVRSALPRWDGEAVIEAPRSARRFAAVSGLSVASANGIAAVTTSPDGSQARGGPERVFLNPAVFGPLGPVGQQIVLSHELTHVAVDGATSAMPLWLSEGYADYVALRDSDVPVSTLAAQILRLVRTDEVPRALPRGSQFDGADPDVGAWYESSWLAARLLAQEYGEPALHRFYRQADRDGATTRAFRQLGTTERAFTRQWRAELERLAR